MSQVSDSEKLRILDVRASTATDGRRKSWEVVAEETGHSKSTVIKADHWLQGLSWEVVNRVPENVRRLRDDYVEHLDAGSEATHTLEVAEKLRDHELFLVSGLQALVWSSLTLQPFPRSWEWSTGEPRRRTEDEDLEFVRQPLKLETRCLLHHMDRDDPILICRRQVGEDFKTYRHLCGDLYGEFVEAARKVAREADVPLRLQTDKPVRSAVTPEFVEFPYHIVENLLFGDYHGGSGHRYTRDEEPHGESLSRLCCGGRHIAIGSEDQLDMAEAAHRDLCSAVDQRTLVQELIATRQRHEKRVQELSESIEIRAQQRQFPPGPCEICVAWGGPS